MALLHDKGLCQYLLQNLVREGEVWRWRVNLEGLQVGMSEILGFPTTATGRQYPGATLFIYGSESDYVTEAHGGAIQDYFPYARLRMVPAAGHWVYSEQPEAFIALLTSFLN
ncbi:MAG: esterase, partial [Sedimenticola sp.]